MVAVERPTPTPFLRWCGGKRWLVDRLVPEILATSPSIYIEPFLGGGAIALGLPPKLPKILSDANVHLIDVWICIQKMPGHLFAELTHIEDIYGNELEGYLQARDEFNFMAANPRRVWARRAALFLFLNARCFNGLWRINSKGRFNVPFGKLTSPKKIEADELARLSAALFNSDFRGGDFVRVLCDLYTKFMRGVRCVEHRAQALHGLALYVDSPYDGTFDGYAKDGFGEPDQRVLANLLASWAAAGAAVWATNADTELVRHEYAWAQIESIDEHHHVGATGDRRGKRGCVLIRGGAACRGQARS